MRIFFREYLGFQSVVRFSLNKKKLYSMLEEKLEKQEGLSSKVSVDSK